MTVATRRGQRLTDELLSGSDNVGASTQTVHYLWIFVFDAAGRAALDAATLRSGGVPAVQGTHGVAVVTEHFEDQGLGRGAVNMDIAVEGSNQPNGSYDI